MASLGLLMHRLVQPTAVAYAAVGRSANLKAACRRCLSRVCQASTQNGWLHMTMPVTAGTAISAGKAQLSTQARSVRRRTGGLSRKRRRTVRADAAAPPVHHHGVTPGASHVEGAGNTTNMASISPADTAVHARRTLLQVHAGVQDMEDSNPGMQVSIDSADRVIIELGPEWDHAFELEFDGRLLHLFSPLDMKRHTYQLDARYDGWLCVENGHQLLELLMRQLTGRFNGFPKF